MMPKIECLKTDLIERNVDVAHLQEIWEKDNEEDPNQAIKCSEIEKIIETLGLHYFSNPRPLTKKGYAY